MKPVIIVFDDDGRSLVVGPFDSITQAREFGEEIAPRTDPLSPLTFRVEGLVSPEQYKDEGASGAEN